MANKGPSASAVRVCGVSLAHWHGMSGERKGFERRTHPYGRAQFEALRTDLERRLRRIYGRDWPQGLDDVIARITRARIRSNYGLTLRA
jgi:predicted aminopeptidase